MPDNKDYLTSTPLQQYTSYVAHTASKIGEQTLEKVGEINIEASRLKIAAMDYLQELSPKTNGVGIEKALETRALQIVRENQEEAEYRAGLKALESFRKVDAMISQISR